jgi:hypothetical protein
VGILRDAAQPINGESRPARIADSGGLALAT